MKLSRPALALALSASLLLSACSGSEDPDESTDPTSSSADDGVSTDDSASATGGDDASTTGDTGVSTGDAGEATSAPGDAAQTTDDGKITAPAEGAGVISVEEAEEIAATLMRQAGDSQNADPEEAAELNEKTFVGSELRAAEAATALREVGIDPIIDYHPTNPNVLAISREDGESPAFIVVQSVPESGLPELHLLVSEDDGETWKIGWSAPMLAGTEVPTFDPRSEGSPVLREGKGDLNWSPSQVVDQLFVILDFPFAEDRPDFRTNDYGPQVRKAAEQQAAEVADQATLTQEHDLRTGTLRTIELADGSAITFPVLRRTSTFDVKSGTYLEAPAAFAHLSGEDVINNSAKMTTDVFLAVHIKTEGDPVVIAAREQVVRSDGS
ncbi:hypothetical protein FNH13_15990 [Ornithinimicrobium ciconiae]|uniref:Uncharacterized protein n=1 Tax=Ornithinimicrobium ciconiae TaxID=2594265 RepID=A0A516GDR3_9MICO|nr:hypothetical protein [Ornithinimicrobium ciconiae]QDO89647.1 hypothetical protein FNH13_15990 [Ornithinimicrobium ciconiae]